MTNTATQSIATKYATIPHGTYDALVRLAAVSVLMSEGTHVRFVDPDIDSEMVFVASDELFERWAEDVQYFIEHMSDGMKKRLREETRKYRDDGL